MQGEGDIAKSQQIPNKMEREVLGLCAGRGGLGTSSQRTHASQSEKETGSIKVCLWISCTRNLVIKALLFRENLFGFLFQRLA